MATKLAPLPWPVPVRRPEEVEDFIAPILANMVEAAARTLLPRPSRVVHINPGRTVPWDECCDGLLSGRILGITPWTGQGGATSRPCGINEWIVNLGISIIRCVHTVEDDASVPTPAEMTTDGLQMLRDEANLREVIRWNPYVRAMGAWNPLGNMGGCGGGEWTFTLRVPVCNEMTPRIRDAFLELGIPLPGQ